MTPAEAARQYGLEPDALRPVASAYREAAAWRAGGVLLKPYRYGKRQLLQVVRALQHLRDFPLVPQLVPARGGRPYVGRPGAWWYATGWIEGRPPRFPAELAEAAGALGSFHRAAEGYPESWSPSRSWRRRWTRLLGDLRECLRLAGQGRTDFDRAFVRAAPAFIRQAEACVQALDACGYDTAEAGARRRPGFCHRDVTAANLVVDGRGRVCLVDPDTWGPDLRLYDLTRLLLAGCAHNPGAAATAVSAYETLAGPLSIAERRLLPWAYLLPREAWWAGVCHYRRPSAGVNPTALLESAVADMGRRVACVRALQSS